MLSGHYKFVLIACILATIVIDNMARETGIQRSVFDVITYHGNGMVPKSYVQNPLETSRYVFGTWSFVVASWICVLLTLLGFIETATSFNSNSNSEYETGIAKYTILTLIFNMIFTLMQLTCYYKWNLLFLEAFVIIMYRFYAFAHTRGDIRFILQTCVALTLAWTSYAVIVSLAMIYQLTPIGCLIVLLLWFGQMIYLAWKYTDYLLLSIVFVITAGIVL